MLDPDLIDRIRTIFLHDRPFVSITEATKLLGWSRAEMNRALADAEIETTTRSGKRISRNELMAKALELWSFEAIEDALANDAATVLPASIRTENVQVRLPHYQVEMLTHLAQRDRTTISGVLARELDALASTHADELSVTIAEFRKALAWPESETTHVPCEP